MSTGAIYIYIPWGAPVSAPQMEHHFRGHGDSIVRMTPALHVDNLGSIKDIPYDNLIMPGVIPEFKPGMIPLVVTPEQNRTKLKKKKRYSSEYHTNYVSYATGHIYYIPEPPETSAKKDKERI